MYTNELTSNNTNEITIKTVLSSILSKKQTLQTSALNKIPSGEFYNLISLFDNDIEQNDLNKLMESNNEDMKIKFTNWKYRLNEISNYYICSEVSSYINLKISKIRNDREHDNNFDDTLTNDEIKKLFNGLVGTGLNSNVLEKFSWNDDFTLINNNGKLLKRFSKFVKKEYVINLSNETMGIIGSKIESYIKDSIETFIFDTYKCSDGINWSDGKFGKEDSCYYGMYKNSIPTLEHDDDTFAIRFYSSIDDKNGIGRTWIKIIDDNTLVTFNNYGIKESKVNSVIVDFLKLKGIECSTKKISVINEEVGGHNIPYINSNAGSLITSCKDTLTNTNEIDLLLREYDDFINPEILGCECVNCGCSVNDDDTYRNDDDIYCESCYDRCFSTCEHCNDTFNNDDMEYISIEHDDNKIHLCESCSNDINECESCECKLANDNYTMCKQCEDKKEYDLKVGYETNHMNRFQLIRRGQTYFDISVFYNYNTEDYNRVFIMRGNTTNVNDDTDN